MWSITIILIPLAIIATILLLPLSYQDNIQGMMAVILLVTLVLATIMFLTFSVMMLIDKSKQEMIEQGVIKKEDHK
ncbi:hypothetical protein [Staphylococcus pasteuri]|uniref:hypothetical protein n=1 Tax=Staphylococcus pasteuri TaxID=45972 RepID=UPI002DBF76FF|nr:hypothetical protein [Staphylococcus pasteuri]MEB7435536.1 hypothetical protein [Staphylococcus pasteuri]